MLQAFFVYFFVCISLLSLGKLIKTNVHSSLKMHSFVIISILFFTFSMGLRFDVGIDYAGYLDEYKYISAVGKSSLLDRDKWEFLYATITNFLANNKFHFAWLFIITSFLQITFFYLGHLNKKILFLLPYSTFFMIMYLLPSMNNVMRQFIAFMIFFYALKYVFKKDFIRYVLFIAIAFFFHKSVIVVVPFYFFINREIFLKSRKMQYVLVGIAALGGALILNFLWINFSFLFSNLGYNSYDLYGDDLGAVKKEGNTGIGNIITWSVILIVIYFSPRLSKFYKNRLFDMYYNLFFIGVLLKPIFGSFMVMNRLNVYFYSFRFIIMAFLCDYLINKSKSLKDNALGFFLILITLIVFTYELSIGAYNMSPFKFIWE